MKKKRAEMVSGRPAYSYLRFSTVEQRKGDSQRRQSERPEGVCAEQGWVLQTRTYADCGVSGYRGKNRKHGDLSVFLAALVAGELEPNCVLILEDLDRLSRDKIMASMDCARKILEAGCDIYSIIERKLYTRDCLNDPMGLMGLIWRFYVAREESEKKADRSRENWAEKHKQAKEKGTIFTRICPGWLKVVDAEKSGGRFVEVPDKVAIVKKLFAWCIEGMGTQAVMRRLAAEKTPPFRSGWNQKYIWEIWRDRRVLGDLPTHVYIDEVEQSDGTTKGEKQPGEIIAGYYPQVIDQRTFDRAQDAIKSRKGRTGRKGDFVNLFTGLVHYPEHKSTMVLLSKPKRNKTGQHQYRYLASFQSWKGFFPYIAIRYEKFEKFFIWNLSELSRDLSPQTPDGDALETLKAKRANLDTAIKGVADGLEQTGVNLPSVFAKLAEMEGQKTALTREIEEKQRHLTRPALSETRELWDRLSTMKGAELKELRGQIRQRLLLHVERIDVTVDGDHVGVTVHVVGGAVRRYWYGPRDDQQGMGPIPPAK